MSALLRGGISFATPTSDQPPAASGHRFALADRPDEEWLEWTPALRVTSPHSIRNIKTFSAADQIPEPLRASVAWTVERGLTQWWSKRETQSAWMLPTPVGLIGPWDVLSKLTLENLQDQP